MYIKDSDISCGVMQVLGVHDIAFDEFRTELIHLNFPAEDFRKGDTYVFSDNDKGNGEYVAKWIRKYNLGKITSTGWTKNPETGNQINTWLWIYNGRRIPKRAKEKPTPNDLRLQEDYE